jgi:microcystin-dependent protein
MSTPYVGEIRLVGFTFAPVGWEFCQGQLLAISEYDVLFNLLGTTYGGDGVQTFGLPDLRGRAPLHIGTGGGATYVQGQLAGTEFVTLTAAQIPSHTHAMQASTQLGSSASPSGGYFASLANHYTTTGSFTSAPLLTAANSGGNQPHENRMPYLTMNYIISLYGVYPSQN